MIAFSAITNNDRVGLTLFTDDIERFVPPRRAASTSCACVGEILNFKPERQGTNLRKGLEYLNRVQNAKRCAS